MDAKTKIILRKAIRAVYRIYCFFFGLKPDVKSNYSKVKTQQK
jgi:hypothetical protein